ncbi:MAG: Ig-like domain-containing protein [Treponema sp.]|nr:Ig-like domain-containing protein [Treponema sp.]
MRRLFSALFASALVLGGTIFTACDSGSNVPVAPYLTYQEKVIHKDSGVAGASLSLFSVDKSISIADSEAAIGVSFEPANAKVTVSMNTDVVTFAGEPELVDDSWVVRFKPNRLGSFTIDAQSGNEKQSLKLTISSRASKIEISGYNSPIDKNSTVKLSAATTPAASTSKIQWASSDKNVATVDQSGLVTAKGAGVATITATAFNDEDGDGETDASRAAPVTGYVDVEVKGFFLSDTNFVLCNKDQDDKVEAKLVGITGSTVEWESSNTNLFTVAVDSSDDKKATLNYVANGDGEGTVTAKLKDGSGNVIASASAKVYVVPYVMLALGDSIAAGYAPKAMGGKIHDTDLEEPDMLAAYNKYMNRRKAESDNPDYVNEYAYPAVLHKELKKTKHINLYSYAMSGDNTQMLLDKLKDTYCDGTIATKQGEILEAISQADYITLCIGANDILLKVFGTDILTKTPKQFKKAFEDEVPGFQTRFDQIIEKLTDDGKHHVYAMSIYSPYKYFKSQADGGFIPDAQFSGAMKYWINKIVEINNYAEPVITQINEYIKSAPTRNSNVTFVDVAEEVFKDMGNEDYKKYLHPVPERMDFASIIYGMGKQIPIWFDPHPTKAGAEKIAGEYNKVLQ